MASATVAATSLIPVSPRSTAHERTYASGPTSTSNGFSHSYPICHERCSMRVQKQKYFERIPVIQAVRAGVLDRPGSGGAGVLEKPPALDTSWLEKLYQTESGGEGSKEKQDKRVGGGDQFRVLLVDSPEHTEKRVTSILPKVVPNIDSEAARGIFETSKVQGFGIVIVCVQEYAETYCQLLIRNGLSSRIEPDADTV